MSSLMDEILTFNRQFVDTEQYEQFRTDKFPDKKMVIVTCMDTRLVELLPRAMNLRNGDVTLIKSAGAVVAHPFGSLMRSIIVAVYEQNANEIFIVGHLECGMTGLNPNRVLDKAIQNGISAEVLQTIQHSGINLSRWLTGFDHVREGVIGSVQVIRNHPLIPKSVYVHGLIMDPETGKLEVIDPGYDVKSAAAE